MRITKVVAAALLVSGLGCGDKKPADDQATPAVEPVPSVEEARRKAEDAERRADEARKAAEAAEARQREAEREVEGFRTKLDDIRNRFDEATRALEAAETQAARDAAAARLDAIREEQRTLAADIETRRKQPKPCPPDQPLC